MPNVIILNGVYYHLRVLYPHSPPTVKLSFFTRSSLLRYNNLLFHMIYCQKSETKEKLSIKLPRRVEASVSRAALDWMAENISNVFFIISCPTRRGRSRGGAQRLWKKCSQISSTLVGCRPNKIFFIFNNTSSLGPCTGEFNMRKDKVSIAPCELLLPLMMLLLQ